MISLLRNIDLKLAPKKPNQNLSKNSILIKKKKEMVRADCGITRL